MSRRAILPLLLLLAFGLVLFSPLIADPDLWGHVRFGQDTLRTGQIVRADPYSYLTAGQAWVNHEWLSEVMQALAYEAAGAGGIIALNLGLALLTLALLYGRLVARGMDGYGAALVLAAFALLTRAGVLNARPQGFTYLMYALLALLIEGMEERGEPGQKRWPVQTLAVLGILAVWANLHGGVLAGVGLVGAWGTAHLAEAAARGRSWRAAFAPGERAAWAILLLAPLALLLNPYGPDLVSFLLRTATVPRPEIADWEPARVTDVWSQLWLAGVALTALAVAGSRRPKRLALLAPLAVTALLPVLSIRHIPLFAVAAPALAAGHFAGAAERLRGRLAWRAPAWVDRWALPGATVAATGLLLAMAGPRLGGIVIEPRVADFPVRAVEALVQAKVTGNLAVEFNWGEYVIWHLGPGVKVSIDGRRETVYPADVYRENLDFMLGGAGPGEGEWDRLVDRPETEMALVDRTRPGYDLMLTKAGWALAYEDETAALFVRPGSPALRMVAESEAPDWPTNGAGMTFPVE